MNDQLTNTTGHYRTRIETSPSLNGLMDRAMTDAPYLPEGDVKVRVFELTDEDRSEVLAFLAERPLQTVWIAGFIRDNGFTSPHNRGTFYGCRNSEGRLEGVALIGHATLVEARTPNAMKEFGVIARKFQRTHLILGEKDKVAQFWDYYADDGQKMRLACRELLFELRNATRVRDEVQGLRRATLADLDKIIPVHAAMAEDESGTNPLAVDPEGFRARCFRRLELGRVWVLVEGGRLLFKADVVADTPDVVYLEGVWVNPSERRKGVGRRCLRQLCQDLLTRTKVVCVLVNENNWQAQTFYRRCDFKMRGVYDSIFPQQTDRRVSESH